MFTTILVPAAMRSYGRSILLYVLASRHRTKVQPACLTRPALYIIGHLRPLLPDHTKKLLYLCTFSSPARDPRPRPSLQFRTLSPTIIPSFILLASDAHACARERGPRRPPTHHNHAHLHSALLAHHDDTHWYPDRGPAAIAPRAVTLAKLPKSRLPNLAAWC